MPRRDNDNDDRAEPMLRMLDLVRQVPTTRRTVRFYEAQGLLYPAGKDRLRRRLYLRSDLQRLRLIRQLRAAGLPVPAIRDLLDSRVPRPGEEDDAWLERLQAALAEQVRALGLHLADVRRAYDELRGAAAWLLTHRDALRAAAPDLPGGAAGQGGAAAQAPPLLRVLLEQPLLSPPWPRARTARAAALDDGELLP